MNKLPKTFMFLMLFSVLVCTPNLLSAEKMPASITLEDYAKIRCSTDGKDIYVQWKGKVYSSIPGEKQKLLFKIIGLNIARCELKSREGKNYLEFISRELNYYLDPESSALIHRWKNPWTNEELPVMHTANNPVQHKIDSVSNFSLLRSGELLSLSFDVPLIYPNPLNEDQDFYPYSNSSFYQAIEMFTFTSLESEVRDKNSNSATSVHVSWNRQGPWLPWMKMGKRTGSLIYSASGSKVGYNEIDPLVKSEIDDRLPLYAKAPSCFVTSPNETSWTYFVKYFKEYLSKRQFPLPAADIADTCE